MCKELGTLLAYSKCSMHYVIRIAIIFCLGEIIFPLIACFFIWKKRKNKTQMFIKSFAVDRHSILQALRVKMWLHENLFVCVSLVF